MRYVDLREADGQIRTMWILRPFVIVLLFVAVAGVTAYSMGSDHVILWTLAGWIASGPVVLIDAVLRRKFKTQQGGDDLDENAAETVSKRHAG